MVNWSVPESVSLILGRTERLGLTALHSAKQVGLVQTQNVIQMLVPLADAPRDDWGEDPVWAKRCGFHSNLRKRGMAPGDAQRRRHPARAHPPRRGDGGAGSRPLHTGGQLGAVRSTSTTTAPQHDHRLPPGGGGGAAC
jgi:hypothetical protein